MDFAIFWNIPLCCPYVNRRFGGTSVHIRTTRPYIPQDGKIHSYRCESLKPYIFIYIATCLAEYRKDRTVIPKELGKCVSGITFPILKDMKLC
jgi:hypothetical protein